MRFPLPGGRCTAASPSSQPGRATLLLRPRSRARTRDYTGAITISGAFAARKLVPDWWLWLILGLLEIPLGVLALANPGATLAALITVAGIWAVAIGVMRIILAFQVKDLPRTVDETWGEPTRDARTPKAEPEARPTADAV